MQTPRSFTSSTGFGYVPTTPLTPTPPPKKYKSWVFVVNNYTAADCIRLDALSAQDKIDYLVYGKEVGDSGTPHLQGYVVWKNRKTFNSCRDCLPFGAHVERQSDRSTVEEAAAYCRKDGEFKEYVNMI